MSVSANDIIGKIMEKAIDSSTNGEHPGSALKPYHVSQTADQLPNFRIRNAFYRAELERQILEKKEADRRRREREAFEEARLLRKIEEDREKLRREYLDEIEKRRILQEEAARRQHAFAKRLEEIQEEEEKKREEEEKKRQQAIIEKRIIELREAVERRKQEELERKRLIWETWYGNKYPYHGHPWDDHGPPLPIPPVPVPVPNNTLVPARYATTADWDYYKRPWNSRDYVHSAIHPDNLILEDVYFEAPLPILADVYKKLDSEKRRIKDIMKQRIVQGEVS